jgi:hypothetical protein
MERNINAGLLEMGKFYITAVIVVKDTNILQFLSAAIHQDSYYEMIKKTLLNHSF